MKKYLLSLFAIIILSFTVQAQLFQPKDIDKIANYVADELELKGTLSDDVKSIYADYGGKMRQVMKTLKPLPQKQKEIQQLTDEMDLKVKDILPQNKRSDYDTVTEHYRKKGINTSALNKNSGNENQLEKSSKPATHSQSVAQNITSELKNEFKSQLGVDDAQADRLVKLTIEHNVGKKLINDTFKADAVTRSQKMNELNLKTNNKVRSILNEQQYKKFLIILLKNERAGN